MPADDLDAILIQVTIPLPLAMIYNSFLEAKSLSGWLCDAASVIPEAGGRYELTFDSETIPFTSKGSIVRLTPEHEVEFTWIPPPQYDAAVGAAKGHPSTVYVRFQESPEGVDVTLEHAGWPNTEDGEEARSWHFRFWDGRLTLFKEYLLKTAYG
ncbi:MAG: SRPBCC domain-containing protein [Thermoplasmata archaeon]|nr:SRPBCC domain-containing protein [Thermoplasmata archaeon]